MHSSTSIDMRLRNSIVVGFIRTSPSEIVGNSSGKPPADHTPRFTASAAWRRCALQLVSSDHELAMPITGPAVEDDVAEALGLQPRAMHEPVEVGAAEPVAAAQRVGCHGALRD